MPGPPPKDPKLRQRTNRVSTAAALAFDLPDGHKDHDLPLREAVNPWHLETLKFWKEVWASPMAAEYIAADVPGLVILAQLVDRFNWGAVELAAEIRLQRQCFGLTPLDRRRLQWEIQRAESVTQRPPAPKHARGNRSDPRNLLTMVPKK